MTPRFHEMPEGIKVLASIGNVCMQWALLEHSVLYVIFALEDIPPEKGDLIYGSLDWRPRLNMAISLAEHHKAPVRLQKRLKDLRTTVRDEDLSERRNQVVHGVQKGGFGTEPVNFYMARWSRHRKSKDLTAMEVQTLANRISELAQEANQLFQAIGAWKFRDHGGEYGHSPVAIADPVTLLERCKNLYARAADFLRNR